MPAIAPTSTPPPSGRDDYIIRPIYWTLLIVFTVVLLTGIPGIIGFTLGLLMLVASPVLLTVALLSAGRSLFRRCWRRSASILLATVLPIIVWEPILWLANCAHLALTIGFSVGQIGSPFVSDDKRFQAHDWSTGLVTNPSTFLIYDATDRIARPNTRLHGFECTFRVQHVIDHYYLCSF